MCEEGVGASLVGCATWIFPEPRFHPAPAVDN